MKIPLTGRKDLDEMTVRAALWGARMYERIGVYKRTAREVAETKRAEVKRKARQARARLRVLKRGLKARLGR